MSGVSGDFGRLQATINALQGLARVPSQVASVAAPELTEQMQTDTRAERDAYGNPFAPHEEATVKRWGAHPILNLNGDGIGSLKATPAAGAGIEVTADEHMSFAQGGTIYEVVRAPIPNNPSLPAKWREILQRASDKVLAQRLKVAT